MTVSAVIGMQTTAGAHTAGRQRLVLAGTSARVPYRMVDVAGPLDFTPRPLSDSLLRVLQPLPGSEDERMAPRRDGKAVRWVMTGEDK